MWGIVLNRQSTVPVKRQIYTALKEQMIMGRLQENETLPSTRELAAALAVSRSTVCEAYDMLIAEGFALTHQGAPTRVAPGLAINKALQDKTPKPPQSLRTYTADFMTGQPDLRYLPRRAFEQSLKKAAEDLPITALGYTGPQGMPQLREEIAAWLYRSRGICADADDIYITAGATHALHLIAELFYSGNSNIIIEDPCHTGMLKTFLNKGCVPVPIPVDGQGMCVEELKTLPGAPVYVTPSHQFPLGGILPAARRAALIRFAQENGSYIVEDDYDSEFRYCGEPIAPLLAMDPERVIYVGTFSKILYPALRIGFVILPYALQKRWRSLRTYADVQNPVFEQAALADFLHTRKLDRHLQKMRKLYDERRRILLQSLHDAFGEKWRPWGDAAGLHMAVQFEGRCFDKLFEEEAGARGIRVVPVSRHCIAEGTHDDKLLLGYGHMEPEEIMQGIALLHNVLERQ